MKHVWSILCRKSIVDPDTNTINISESLEEVEIFIPEENRNMRINVPLEFELTSYWIKEKDEVSEGIVRISDPKGKKLGEFSFDLGFRDNFTRSRTRIKFTGLVLTGDGEYKFRVGYKSSSGKIIKNVAELPLFVKWGTQKK